MQTFLKAQDFNFNTLAIILERIGDPNVLPYLHITMVFMLYIASIGAKDLLTHKFPWVALSKFLNDLLGTQTPHEIGSSTRFPESQTNDVQPLPEDWTMRGLLWTETYFPEYWFSNSSIKNDEWHLEKSSTATERRARIIHIAMSFVESSFKDEIKYDAARFVSRSGK